MCAVAGAGLGILFARLHDPFWVLGWLIPLILIAVYVLAFQFPVLLFVAPFSWHPLKLC
jgi:hypothetical protein